VSKKRPKPVTSPLAHAPRPHVPGRPPQGQRVPSPRDGNPIAYTPRPPRAPRVPQQRPVGEVPNPRTPKLVRDVHGGVLKDMFEIFPDLPRPPRPAARVRARIPGRHLRRRSAK
jgi:hypothetical protein